MTPERQKIAHARTALILENPFFGALSLRLRIVEDPGCGTAWVDGTSLGYDPAFIAPLTHDETMALIAHEVMHCACGHPWRRDHRDAEQWNTAADYAINGVLRDSGFHLPADALSPDSTQTGRSAEWIFDRLPPRSAGSMGPQSGQGLGEVRDAPDPSAATDNVMSEEDWAVAVRQAETASQLRSDQAAGASRTIAQSRNRVDWRSVLRRFLQPTSADYSWTRPNTRYLSHGLYLPTLRSEEMGSFVVAIDTSGSVDGVLLNQFAAELQASVEDSNPSRVHVLYCDAAIHHVDTFERGTPVTINPKGGGGTDFCPVFDWVSQYSGDDQPVCIVYLTDMYGRFPDIMPELPVLWATPTQNVDAPFGELVVMQ